MVGIVFAATAAADEQISTSEAATVQQQLKKQAAEIAFLHEQLALIGNSELKRAEPLPSLESEADAAPAVSNAATDVLDDVSRRLDALENTGANDKVVGQKTQFAANLLNRSAICAIMIRIVDGMLSAIQRFQHGYRISAFYLLPHTTLKGTLEKLNSSRL